MCFDGLKKLGIDRDSKIEKVLFDYIAPSREEREVYSEKAREMAGSNVKRDVTQV